MHQLSLGCIESVRCINWVSIEYAIHQFSMGCLKRVSLHRYHFQEASYSCVLYQAKTILLRLACHCIVLRAIALYCIARQVIAITCLPVVLETKYTELHRARGTRAFGYLRINTEFLPTSTYFPDSSEAYTDSSEAFSDWGEVIHEYEPHGIRLPSINIIGLFFRIWSLL